MAQLFVFVPTDSSARIGTSERQLIRRHCMKLKNKQPGSRRSKREVARSTADKKVITPARLEMSAEKERRQISSERETVPRPPPSDWSLFRFPEELDIASQKILHQYFIHNPIRDPLCPFKHFGVLVDFDEDPSWCFRLLSSEPLCFHAILLLNSASNDLISRRPLSNVTYQHLRRTLTILNNRITSTRVHQQDILLYVVGILASIAVFFGDYDAAKIHAKGLSELIQLRGGFESIKSNPMIQHSIDRLNFSSILVTELWTPIYNGSVWKEPEFSIEITNLYRSQGMLSIYEFIGPELGLVFLNLQNTTILFNKHYYDKIPVNGTLFQECLGYVHAGLIKLQGQLKDELSKCLHLAMMAFLATTFRLPDFFEHPYCKTLSNKVRLSYTAVKDSMPNLPTAINTWLIFACLISDNGTETFDALTLWKIGPVKGLSWDEIRRQLKQVMWIDAFHDDLGKRAFRRL